MGLLGLGFCGLSLTGCVSRQDYLEVTAANARAQDELKNVHKKLQAAEEERNQLLANLKEMNERLAAKDQEIANLVQARDLWQKRFNELMGRFNANNNAPTPPAFETIALPEPLDKLLMEWARAHPDLVEYDRARGMVKFKTDLLFPPGGDDVAPAAKQALKSFADIIRSAEAVQFHIYVIGHTDDLPIRSEQTKRMHPTNWYLSVHRAVSVMQELAHAGVSEPRMGVMGFGEWHPIAPNAAGHKGNPANRRVEIWIVPPDRFMTGAPTAAPAAAIAAPAADATAARD
jgi:chemotaxis protein MotB